MPRSLTDLVSRDAPTLKRADSVRDAVRALVDSGLPALPVCDDDGHYVGVFGEREFMTALFPGYVRELSSASFVSKSVESLLEKRGGCAQETVMQHMNDEHVEVDEDFADLQIAEVFLHHRVLIVPVLRKGRVIGLVTRSDFFRALAERFLASDAG